ncbi:CPBP family intramembrane glutamic endopeptidase [Salmonirosea aquatica]|uniref:CPBP family intramembrane metalloprotease n=1 Tax=Salmonirosea aquatica TaxID=2654236 RepID=A0A7C9BA85_9BACT|nr:CPBP family intramembrane metalloprotease [Cytophagaceae bacterium SJW1-29]
MQNTTPLTLPSRVPNTWRSLLVLVGFILVGMSVGNILAVLVLVKVLGSGQGIADMDIINTLIRSPQDVPNGWYALLLLQAMAHVSTYLIPPLLYWFYIERRKLHDFRTRPFTPPVLWGLTLVVVLAFMPLNSLIIEWNAEMKLPDALGGVEQWMRSQEDQLARLTDFMTAFETPKQFVVAMLVIGVLPAIGEEVLFRGVLQRKLTEQWVNPHLAIWVAAALFSAIHVQFYGFLPRMLLGALFGYLYYWSGSLLIAIFAHFVNNGIMVLMLYLYHLGLVDYNIEDNESVPWPAALASLVVTVALLYGIRRQSKPQVA